MSVRVIPLKAKNPRALAHHFLRGTEPRAERDQQRALQHDLSPGAHRGSVPRVQADMPVEVQEATGLHPRRTPTRQDLENVLSGLRADGRPLPRAARAKTSGRVTAILVSSSVHTSISIGHALASPAAQALFQSAIRGAHADMMAWAEREVFGWTRRGAQGAEEVPGKIGRIDIDHYTTRKTRDGRVAPNNHIETIIPNLVVADDHFGAVHLRRLKGRMALLTEVFQQRLHHRLSSLGANVRMEDGACILADVPPALVKAMARRTAQAEADARAYAKAKGLDWDQLSPGARSKLVKVGARRTEGSRHDGVADRAAWATEARTFGFEPRDLIDPARAAAAEAPSRHGSLLQRAASLRRAVVEAAQTAQHMAEAAVAAGRALPSLAEAAGRRRFKEALAEATADMRAAVRVVAPPPSQQARERVARLGAAVRAGALAMLRPVATEARTQAHEWVEAYRLGPVVRVSTVAARWSMKQIRTGALTRAAAMVRHAAVDGAKAALAGTGAMRQTFAALRFARLAEAGNQALRERAAPNSQKASVLPVAKRNTRIRAMTAPPPETPLERRAREVREAAAQMAASLPQAAQAVGARVARAGAAAALRSLAQATSAAAGEMYGPPMAAAPANTEQYGPPAPGGLLAILQPITAASAPALVAGPLATSRDPGEALLQAHGTPQNALNARARTLGALVARGEMSMQDAMAGLYRTWKSISSDEAARQADPEKVMHAIEVRLTRAAEEHYARLMKGSPGIDAEASAAAPGKAAVPAVRQDAAQAQSA